MIEATDIGKERIRIVDPLDLEAVSQALDDARAVEGPFVIVAARPCAMLKEVRQANVEKYCVIDTEKCQGCKMCLKIACPVIAFIDDKAVITDPESCNGCGLCMQVCNFEAISKAGA